jgi:hypothetical protein
VHLSIFSALNRFPDQLEELYGAFPEAYAHWAPPSWDGIPSERFTAIEQICHIRDIEIDGYHLRLRRLLNEDGPALVSIDSYQVARHRKYLDAPVKQIFSAFREARTVTVNLLESLTDNQWRRRGSFEGYGPVTVKGLAHYLCSHDQQHLAGLQWLLGQIESGPAAAAA